LAAKESWEHEEHSVPRGMLGGAFRLRCVAQASIASNNQTTGARHDRRHALDRRHRCVACWG